VRWHSDDPESYAFCVRGTGASASTAKCCVLGFQQVNFGLERRHVCLESRQVLGVDRSRRARTVMRTRLRYAGSEEGAKADEGGSNE
jgi:hypothetical protein